MAVNYKDLGLVNTREMFKRAVNGGYAIPAFNFNNLEQLQAIITASSELRSPVILQVSKGARNYANPILLRYMAEGAVEYAKSLGCNHPEIVLHLDHGDSFELVKLLRQSWVSSLVLRMRFLLKSLTIHVLRRSSSSASVLAATLWLSPSVLLMVLTSSSPSSAHVTRRQVA